MPDINAFSPRSGRQIKEDGSVINVAQFVEQIATTGVNIDKAGLATDIKQNDIITLLTLLNQYVDGLEGLITAIKDVDGIKKIVDAVSSIPKTSGGVELFTTTQPGNVALSGRTTEEVKRQTLTANTVATLTFSVQCEHFEIQNFGTVDVYFDKDTDPAVDGANSILVPAGMGVSMPLKATTLKFISTGTPKIQVVGLR